MNEHSKYHIAGGIYAANASEIANALRPMPHLEIRLSDEVAVQGESYDLDIYPTKPGEYLIGGTLELDHEEARDLVATITLALKLGGLVYQIELSPEDGGSDEQFTHPDFKKSKQAVLLSVQSPASNTVVLGELLYSGTGEEVRRGEWHSQPALLTFTGSQTLSLDAIHDRLSLNFDGVTPLLYCGASPTGVRYVDMIAEKLPEGRPIPECAPLTERVTAKLGCAIANVVIPMHAANVRVDGLRPELVYVNDEDAFVALVPRGPAFAVGAPMPRGMRAYYVPYISPETLFKNVTDVRSDVFSLCATLWFATMAGHPFGDPDRVSAMVQRMLTATTETWTGSPELGEILVRGMSVEPAQRPTMQQLAKALLPLSL